MYSAVMLLLAAINVALLIGTFRQFLQTRLGVFALLSLAVLAMPYDTALVGLGSRIGEGDLLRTLSAPRFMSFHLTAPILLIIAVLMARLADFAWARPPWLLYAACAVTALAIGYDWRNIVQGPTLYPECWADTLRYVSRVDPALVCGTDRSGVDTKPAFPPGALPAIVALLGLSIALLWKRRWPWLLLGMVAGQAVLALPRATVGPVPGFIGDFLNMFAIVGTAAWLARQRVRSMTV